MQVLLSTEPWEGVTSQLGKSFIVTLVYAYPINLGLMSSELEAWLKWKDFMFYSEFSQKQTLRQGLSTLFHFGGYPRKYQEGPGKWDREGKLANKAFVIKQVITVGNWSLFLLGSGELEEAV